MRGAFSKLASWLLRGGAPQVARRRMVGLGLLLVLCAAVVQIGSPSNPSQRSVLSRLDLLLYDWRFQLLPPRREARIPIVIVDLDEATQQREGRWPWDRSKVADLLQAIRANGALLIGFDVVFSERGPNAVQQLLEAGLPESVQQALQPLSAQFDGDKIFAETLDMDTVLGYFLHVDGASVGALPLPFHQLVPGQAVPSVPAMPDYTANLGVLAESAAFSGFVVAVPDADGIVRRMPLVLRHGTGLYASLGLEMARIALGAPWLRLSSSKESSGALLTGVQVGRQLHVPLDAQGNMLIPYRGGARSYPTISATQVLQNDLSDAARAALDGALVLVGTSALGLADLRTMPLQTGYPGVEAHANIVDTLIQAALGEEVFYFRPDWEPGASLLLLLASGILLAFYLPRRAPATMMLLALGWLVLVLLGNGLLWRYWHWDLPLALPLLTVVALALLNIVAGYLLTNRQKHTIQSLFGEYVPAAYVERMVAEPERVSLDGEQREMTVLFADVRNFTALSENLPATALKQLLNRYLSAVTEVIFKHQGTIDKYVGDLVMAFWNAPLDDPKHAQHAVAAALAMQQRMVALRKEFAAEGLPELHIGIGLNTGIMNVGDMGSRYRRAYTVLGDAVNLASRLEGLCPWYGVPVLVSDATRAACPNMVFRTIDLVKVKGRSEAVEISQPLGEHAKLEPQALAIAQRFGQFLQYYRAQRWQEAQLILSELTKQDPACAQLYALYATRLEQTAAPGWSPVYSHEQK